MEDQNLCYALHLAAKRGDLKCLLELLDQGAAVDAVCSLSPNANPSGATALLFAAENGHVECLLALLDRGANVDAVSSYGMTALGLAASNAHVDCLQALLERGATVDFLDQDEITPLLHAAASGPTVRSAEFMYGSEVGWYGRAIAECHRRYARCLEALLDAGAAINFTEADIGVTALMKAAHCGRLECVHVLLKRGAAMDLVDLEGEPAVAWAVNGGHVSCLQALLDHGAAVNFVDDAGETALMKAAWEGSLECLVVVADAGVAVDHVNNSGDTALIYAASNGKPACLRALLERGAATDLVNRDGDTALGCAVKQIHHLESRNPAKKSPGHLECIRELTDHAERVAAAVTIQRGWYAARSSPYTVVGRKHIMEGFVELGSAITFQ